MMNLYRIAARVANLENPDPYPDKEVLEEVTDPDDPREFEWSGIEADVQERGDDKDETFVLNGPWKKFVREQDGFKIYAVDGEWIRNNLSIIFGHGGHGYVHEFIPLDEIWIATHHYDENDLSKCECDVETGPVSLEYFESCILHEIEEFNRMESGEEPYWTAHQKAIELEDDLELLDDPDSDSGETEIPESWYESD